MIGLPAKPNWERDGRDWPNRETSRFVEAADLRWHVQEMGEGPPLLLIHGTAAATHSWRDLMPVLARHFTVIAPDLPGHGFTDMPSIRRLTLPGMAHSVSALLKALDVRPTLVLGHSAGSAILIQMVLDGSIAPRGIVSVNGALSPFPGMAGFVFPQMAKLLFLNPFTPRVFSWTAGDEGRVARVIRETGSVIDPQGLALYTRLFRNPSHVAGALGMMANWDLHGFARRLGRLATPLLLIAGDKDAAVAPSVAQDVAAQVPGAQTVVLPGLGHLAHEEDPETIAPHVLAFARRHGIVSRDG